MISSRLQCCWRFNGAGVNCQVSDGKTVFRACVPVLGPASRRPLIPIHLLSGKCTPPLHAALQLHDRGYLYSSPARHAGIYASDR